METTARVLDMPPNYRAVFDVLREAGSGTHLRAQEIWDRARARRPGIGFATVHRALARLHRADAVLKIDVPGDASSFYEVAARTHAHFRCVACGSLSDVAYAVPGATRRALAREHGVAIDEEAVTFMGRCANCTT